VTPVAAAAARAPGVVSRSRPAVGSAGRKISVLHLIYSPCYGGIETNVINWVRHFDRDAFDVHVAYFAGDRNREAPFLRAAAAAGIHALPVPWTRWKPFLRAAREVARIVREKRIEIVHTHAYYGDAVGAIAGKLTDVKTVATVYVWGRYEMHRQLMQLIDWLSIQFMDRVTAHCADTQKKTFVIGTSRADITVLRPGFPGQATTAWTGERRRERRRAAGVDDRHILLVNAARLAPEKVQDQLLRSFRIVHERYPHTRLWIKGVGLDWVERDLLALRAQLGLDDVVRLGGFAEDLDAVLGMADMMVHSSLVEGVPLSIMHGMAAGLPIVASDAGGIAEVIHHGRTGLVVAKNDPQGFAEAVISLLERPDLARALGSAARHAVEHEHSIASAVRHVEQVYREMVMR
jgi:glycosyltransferase involved in cell wall biosynthesis